MYTERVHKYIKHAFMPFTKIYIVLFWSLLFQHDVYFGHMPRIARIYDTILKDHLEKNRQMLFVSGPRQVGKTNCCSGLSDVYWNWDRVDIQPTFIKGAGAIAEKLDLETKRAKPLIITFDEVHKYPKWKNVLKGLFDTYADSLRVMVTGSSRLDIYRRGSDSLMGRYFLYRMHPLSVAEILQTDIPTDAIIRPPSKISPADWDALWQHGGFPEPYVRRDITISRRWRSSRLQQLTKEDLREVSLLQDLGAMDALTRVLADHSSQQLVYSSLAQEVSVSPVTVKRWVDLLERMHYGFLIRPWAKGIANSIRKEPKWFLRDWSGIENEGQRTETFIACHLLKAVEGWTDLGLGEFELRYIRNKQGEEVDFLVVRDRKPWFLVEAKHSNCSITPGLHNVQKKIQAPYAFQVTIDMPYVQVDCFTGHTPVKVPAQTFLSQLL